MIQTPSETLENGDSGSGYRSDYLIVSLCSEVFCKGCDDWLRKRDKMGFPFYINEILGGENMKRKLSFVLALLMVAALFSACGTKLKPAAPLPSPRIQASPLKRRRQTPMRRRRS